MNNAIYNSIGKTYDITRKADPTVAQIIIKLLEPRVWFFRNYVELKVLSSKGYNRVLTIYKARNL
jgi:hypothetical protein